MQSRTHWQTLGAAAGSILALAMLMGQGCPNAAITLPQDLGATKVLSATSQGSQTQPAPCEGRGELLFETFTAAPFTATFTPTATGQIVEIRIASDNSASRITFTVTDPSGAAVAGVTNPSTNISSTTFTPETAGTYTITATETGTAATTYRVAVGQRDGEEPGEPTGHGEGRGALLLQTFASAPITATFSPTQTGQVVEVAVSGNDAASRVTFSVTDPSGATVAGVTNPSTNTSSTTFTPEAAGTYTISATETGTAATLYRVAVDEQGLHGHGKHRGGPGALLFETFTSAPITATFTPAQTGLVAEVVVAGDNSASRLTFTVTDPSGATVASVTNPSTNTSSTTFTPEAAGTYTVNAAETGTAATLYVVSVRQPQPCATEPGEGPRDDHFGGFHGGPGFGPR